MTGQTAIAYRPSMPETIEQDCVVAVYDSHASAEVDVRGLKNSGLDMQQVSVIGRDYTLEDGVVGFYRTGGSMKSLAKTSAFWSGLWGMQEESALFVVPEIGPLFAAGPLVGWIVDALKSGPEFDGLSAVGACLHGNGIPRDCAVRYDRQIKGGKFIVIVHGASSQVETSKVILPENSQTYSEIQFGVRPGVSEFS